MPKREHMPPDFKDAIEGIKRFHGQAIEREKYINIPFSKELLTHLNNNNQRLLNTINMIHPVVFYRDILINGIKDFEALYNAAQQKKDQEIFSALMEKLKWVIYIAEQNTTGSKTLTSLKQLQKSLSPEPLQQPTKPTTASLNYKRRKLTE